MQRNAVSALVAGLVVHTTAYAQNIHVTPPNALVSEAVRVPTGSEMIYVAGQLPDPTVPAVAGQPAHLGDTKVQTISVLTKIQSLLKEQGYAMSDVVMMRVVLVGDPAKGDAMDFAGMYEAYAQFFGSSPGKPARFTSQGVALSVAGALVEIEVQAAKMEKKPKT
jgi:enamine deaminase RidA (YjgF/YER057c/UK114 family)